MVYTKTKSIPLTQKYTITRFPGLVQLLRKWRGKTNSNSQIFMFCVTEKSQHGNYFTKYENIFVKGLCGRMACMA
jgi:hypothetical protein